MKKFLAALLLLVSAVAFADIVTVPIPGAPGLSVTVGTGANALPLQNIQNNPNATNITTYDDSYNNVPLGFDFPYFGRTFNNSWAATNGYVTFVDPARSGLGGGCCSGVDLSRTTSSAYNYTIYGLHTDLYSWNGRNQWYLRESNAMTYGWYNISQCCSSQGGNSFEIKITSSGTVDTRIAGALVQWNAVTSGMSGDLSKGEYYQYYHGQGINISSSNPVSWNTAGGFTGVDQCVVNPLSSPTCAGYAAAYLSQQCSISALYNQSCPGYAAAYFTQQCNSNPLYDPNCPGYATAYLDYRCSLDALYSTTCSGYETAYHDQQCSLNPLYARDCNGYATAYYNQQCSLNPLYATTCTGYGAAYLTQQCNISQLYSTQCPNYQQAYFSQQCTANALYDKQCPGYAEAYALKYVVVTKPVATTTTSTTTTPAAPTTDSSGTVTPTVVADPVVNQVVTSTATSASPAQSATATVPLVVTPTVTTTTTQAAPPPPVVAVEPPKEQPKTARQEMQAKREAAARTAAVEKGKNLANEMGKSADMESQKQVQNVVMQAMGYTPGFDAYGKAFVPDGVGYKPYSVYNNQKNVDNRKVGMGLYGPSDRLHNDLVNSQYKD